MHDLYHDPGHGRLRHLLPQYPGVADFVKTSEFEDHVEEIPKTAFAWPGRDLFPVHTPEHAAVSYLYLKTAEHYALVDLKEPGTHPLWVRNPVLKTVLASIEEALDAYGIDRTMFEPVATKEAALQEDECLFPESNSYPVRNAEEVKEAEAHLLPQIPKLHPETRAQVFHKLAKAAALHGVKLQPTSRKYAGLVHTSRAALVEGLRARAALTKVADCRSHYMQLADAAKQERGRTPHALKVKLAEAIGTLDTQAGLVRYYDRGIPDPISTVFNTEKAATSGDVDLGGALLNPSSLGGLDPQFFADLLGDDIVRDIAPSGHVEPDLALQVLQTLPATEKRHIAQALIHAGVAQAG